MKEKELIEVIVDHLKDLKEPAYKPGSWESFKSKNTPKGAIYRVGRVWYAAASLLLLAGFAWIYLSRNPSPQVIVEKSIVHNHGQVLDKMDATDNRSTDPEILSKEGEKGEILALNDATPAIQRVETDRPRLYQVEENRTIAIHIPQMSEMKGEAAKLSGSWVSLEQDNRPMEKFNGTNHILAMSHDPLQTMRFKAVEEKGQMKNIRLADKIELGLFVSPYATSQNMNFGGGFTLGYQLTKRLTVRTGLAYSTFEMNQIKNPIEVSSVETVSATNAINAKVTDSYNTAAFSRFQSTVVVPNVNAIKGFVQSLDVPVEFKLHASKSFYAVAGVSYSAILNQQRNAYYVDNINSNTFAEDFPETYEQAAKAVQVVTKNIESTEQNVNTNGFSGFVNFSVGKTVRVSNRMGVSVEPYYRVPMGQFRRTDMNYSNGGIRIMTNF